MLFKPEELAGLLQQLRTGEMAALAEHLEDAATWLAEVRRECFGVLSLGANLSKSFFDADSNVFYLFYGFLANLRDFVC